MYVSLSVRLSVSLSIGSSASLFGNHKSAVHNFTHRMRPQAMGSNPLSGSIRCLSVRPSVQTSTGLLIFLYLYSFPVWGSSAAIHLSPTVSGV